MSAAASLMLFVSSAAQSQSYVRPDIVSKETARTYFLLVYIVYIHITWVDFL